MAYRTHCDWCGEYLAPDADRAVMPVTIEHPRIGPKRLADIRRAVKWYREKATVA